MHKTTNTFIKILNSNWLNLTKDSVYEVFVNPDIDNYIIDNEGYMRTAILSLEDEFLLLCLAKTSNSKTCITVTETNVYQRIMLTTDMKDKNPSDIFMESEEDFHLVDQTYDIQTTNKG